MTANSPINELVEKISNECREATATEWDITKIIKALSLEKSTDLEELREKAIFLLEQINPKAAKIYSSFHLLKVKTSRLEIEAFDRGNIIKSLLKETNVNRTIAEKIGHEVEDKIKDLKIANLTTALIREMVNAKLLEYGHELVRNQYARIGIPVFEIEKKLEKGFYSNRPLLLEYNLLKVIPLKISEMHFEKSIHISDIAGFSGKCFAYCNQSPESIVESPISLLGKCIELQKFFSKPLCFNSLNFSLSHNIKSKRESAELAENFSNALKCLSRKHLVSMNLFTPANSVSKNRDIAIEFGLNFLQKPQNFLPKAVAAIDSKFKLKLFLEKIPNDLLFLNCNENESMILSENLCCEKNLAIASFALNLQKISEKNLGKESAFFRELESKTAALKELAVLKTEILLKKNFLQKHEIELDGGIFSIELNGLENSSKTFLETGTGREIFAFSEKVLNFLKKSFGEKFAFTELESAFVKKRFESVLQKPLQLQPSLETANGVKKPLKGFVNRATAKNLAELSDLIDSGCQLIEFSNYSK